MFIRLLVVNNPLTAQSISPLAAVGYATLISLFALIFPVHCYSRDALITCVLPENKSPIGIGPWEARGFAVSAGLLTRSGVNLALGIVSRILRFDYIFGGDALRPRK